LSISTFAVRYALVIGNHAPEMIVIGVGSRSEDGLVGIGRRGVAGIGSTARVSAQGRRVLSCDRANREFDRSILGNAAPASVPVA